MRADRLAALKKTFITTALFVGAVDIAWAIGFSYLRAGTAPQRVLQSVAAGWFGREAAFAGGAGTAAAGLGFHFFNAFVITAIFFAAASWQRWLVRNPAIVGPLYGLGVYVVMNFVVIPLSAIAVMPKPNMIGLASGLFIHVFGVGLPIVLGAGRALRT